MSLAAFSCPHCGFSDASMQYDPESKPACPKCGGAALHERVEGLIRRHQGADERAGRIRLDQEDIKQRLTVIAEELGNRDRTRKDDIDHLAELTRAHEEERKLREGAEAQLAEALARLESLRGKTEPALVQLRQENEEYARQADQARVAVARLEKELEALSSPDQASAPIDQTLGYLEEENAALRKKLALAEEMIVNAARAIGGIDELRDEVDRLGTLYLQAREDANRFMEDKHRLEQELSQIVDRFLTQSPVPLPPPPEELEAARKKIREAGDSTRRGETPD